MYFCHVYVIFKHFQLISSVPSFVLLKTHSLTFRYREVQKEDAKTWRRKDTVLVCRVRDMVMGPGLLMTGQ